MIQINQLKFSIYIVTRMQTCSYHFGVMKTIVPRQLQLLQLYIHTWPKMLRTWLTSYKPSATNSDMHYSITPLLDKLSSGMTYQTKL